MGCTQYKTKRVQGAFGLAPALRQQWQWPKNPGTQAYVWYNVHCKHMNLWRKSLKSTDHITNFHQSPAIVTVPQMKPRLRSLAIGPNFRAVPLCSPLSSLSPSHPPHLQGGGTVTQTHCDRFISGCFMVHGRAELHGAQPEALLPSVCVFSRLPIYPTHTEADKAPN